MNNPKSDWEEFKQDVKNFLYIEPSEKPLMIYALFGLILIIFIGMYMEKEDKKMNKESNFASSIYDYNLDKIFIQNECGILPNDILLTDAMSKIHKCIVNEFKSGYEYGMESK